jgi:hypothetical protein
MVYEVLNRKRKTVQQEQGFSEINDGLQSTNQKSEIEQQEQSLLEINNGLQRINQRM